MLKMEKEYKELYGDIPENKTERIEYLITGLNLDKYKEKIKNTIDRIRNIKWNTLKYTIYLLPKATPRPRSGRNGIFYVKGASDNKKFFKEFIRNEDIHLITTPTKFQCVSYLPIPKSMNPVEKVCAELGLIYPVSRPDWDNLGKTYSDMIQDLLICDDAFIVDGISKKRYSIKPRIEITISYMEEYDSEFNKKKILKKGL